MKPSYFLYAILAVVLVALLAGWVFSLAPFLSAPNSTSGLRTIHLDGNTISVLVADTDATRELGLGGRTGLAPDEGMLFVFPKDGVYAFWMKNMQFSIDMLWITVDGKIVYMAQNVSPDTYPKDFVPTAPSRYVLELSASWASTHGVRIGDSVAL